MAGTLLVSGQTFVLDQMLDYFNTSGVYIGLMKQTSTVSQSSNIAAGIVEIDPTGEATGSGYARLYSSGWVLTESNDPFITGPTVTFTVSGVWQSVNGYFISLTETGNDAIMAEPLPAEKQGDKTDGDTLKITPKYTQYDYYE